MLKITGTYWNRLYLVRNKISRKPTLLAGVRAAMELAVRAHGPIEAMKQALPTGRAAATIYTQRTLFISAAERLTVATSLLTPMSAGGNITITVVWHRFHFLPSCYIILLISGLWCPGYDWLFERYRFQSLVDVLSSLVHPGRNEFHTLLPMQHLC